MGLLRQRSFVLFVHELERYRTPQGANPGAGKAAENAKKGVRTFSADGEPIFTKSAMLRELLVEVYRSGRYFEVGVTDEERVMEQEVVVLDEVAEE